jgi:hypothetical protein
MSMLEILFQIMAGFWSRCYTDRLAEKRESYTRIFFTIWFWFLIALCLLFILEGTFKISQLHELLILSALVAAGSVVFIFTYLWSYDYTKEHKRKKALEKALMDKANETHH